MSTFVFCCDKLCTNGACCSPLRYALRETTNPRADARFFGDATFAAHVAIHDPKKQAKLITMALRARGFTIEAVYYGAVSKRSYPRVLVEAGVWNNKPMILIQFWDITNEAKIGGGIPQMFFLEHTQARLLLLDLMATPANKSSFEVVKRIIAAG